MFKNPVWNVNVNTKKWFKAAGIRAVKTVAQAAVGGIGAAAAMDDIVKQFGINNERKSD